MYNSDVGQVVGSSPTMNATLYTAMRSHVAQLGSAAPFHSTHYRMIQSVRAMATGNIRISCFDNHP